MKIKVCQCDCGHIVPADEIYGVAKVDDSGCLDICLACRTDNPAIEWANSSQSDLRFTSLNEQHKHNARGKAYDKINKWTTN